MEKKYTDMKYAWKTNFNYSENFGCDKIETLSYNSISYVCL